MKKKTTHILCAALACAGLQANAHVARDYDRTLCGPHIQSTTAGTLDTTFNPSGVEPGTEVIAIAGQTAAQATAVAIQGDSKTIVVGTSSASGVNSFAVARLNVDGSLDTSFNSTGINYFSISGQTNASATSVAIDYFGNIVVAGSSNSGGVSNFAVARLTPNGVLDATFGIGGTAHTAILGQSGGAFGQGIAFKPNGAIVVVGYSVQTSVDSFALAQFTFNGSLDITFNTTGTQYAPISGQANAYGYDAVVQQNGAIVVAGYSTQSGVSSFAAARLNSNGSLDTTFNSTGTTYFAISGQTSAQAYSVALQRWGDIVIGGYSTDESGTSFALAQLEPNGSLDTSFNTVGTAYTAINSSTPGPVNTGSAIAIQKGGKIIIAGQTSPDSTNYLLGVARFNTNGTLDTSFNPSGSLPGTTATTINNTYINSSVPGVGLAIGWNGNITAAGGTAATPLDFAVARFDGITCP